MVPVCGRRAKKQWSCRNFRRWPRWLFPEFCDGVQITRGSTGASRCPLPQSGCAPGATRTRKGQSRLMSGWSVWFEGNGETASVRCSHRPRPVGTGSMSAEIRKTVTIICGWPPRRKKKSAASVQIAARAETRDARAGEPYIGVRATCAREWREHLPISSRGVRVHEMRSRRPGRYPRFLEPWVPPSGRCHLSLVLVAQK